MWNKKLKFQNLRVTPEAETVPESYACKSVTVWVKEGGIYVDVVSGDA